MKIFNFKFSIFFKKINFTESDFRGKNCIRLKQLNYLIANNLIDVDKDPIASFNTDITFSCNVTETVNFSNTSLYGTDYFWDFGDGTTSALASPSHTFTAGLYTVSLCAKSGGLPKPLSPDQCMAIRGNGES